MKLKTLKDLCVDACSIDSFSVVDSDELRLEVIKWIKEEISIKINQFCPTKESNLQVIALACTNHPDVKRWMERFNLTEGDLK